MHDFSNRPGDALASLIPVWSTSFNGKCSCKDYQRKMNNWGWELCSGEHHKRIVDHLVTQKKHLTPILRSMPDALLRKGASILLARALDLSKPADHRQPAEGEPDN